MQSLRRRHSPDYLLISAMALLMGLGLVIIYSISPVLSHKLLGEVSDNHFLYGQLVHVTLGTGLFVLASNIHYSRWQKYLPALIVVCGFLLMLLLIPGVAVSKNGATRWVGLGPFSAQPAELMKLTMVLFLAQQWSGKWQQDPQAQKRQFRLALLAFALTAVSVLFLQRDMGTMMVLAAIIFGLYFVAGASLKHLLRLSAIGLSTAIGSILLFPHRIARFLTYLDPSETAATTGYHLNQALIAIGSGGLWGLGIGKSIQVYGYLPEAANDSIFAIMGETFGFVGSVVVLGLFTLLIYRGIKIGLNAPSRFSQLLALGITIWLSAQIIINMTAMLGLVPLTGIPLPFLSYGGTSLVVSATALGILANISKYTKRGDYAQNRFGGRGHGRTYNAYAPLRPGPKTLR